MEETLSLTGWLFCFLISVATVLGTGILALPVKLADCGYAPFATVFTLTLMAQVSVVIFTVEVLQRARRRLRSSQPSSQNTGRCDSGETYLIEETQDDTSPNADASMAIHTAYTSAGPDADVHTDAVALTLPPTHGPTHGVEHRQQDSTLTTNLQVNEECEDPSTYSSDADSESATQQGTIFVVEDDVAPTETTLHDLGRLYLTGALRVVFNISAMLHFVSLLISYALAWCKALCQLVGCKEQQMISPMVFVFSTAIIVFSKQLQVVITALTFFKCIMLVVMISVVGYIGAQVDLGAHDATWSAIGSPFLIGTLAIGGVVNVMPVLYGMVPNTAPAHRRFRSAVVSGIVVCWILNMLWAFFIVDAVPLDGPPPCHQDVSNGTISLTCSASHDEISTQPLVDVIDRKFPSLLWLGELVGSFILVSITVSYMTIGSAMKHMLDGQSRTHSPDGISDDGTLYAKCWMCFPESARTELVQRLLYYLFWFTLVLIIAQVNPQGFLMVLEIFTSLSLNIEAGAGVCLLFYIARKQDMDIKQSHPSTAISDSTYNNAVAAVHPGNADAIPLPLSTHWARAWVPVALYFSFAVVYDLVTASWNHLGLIASSVLFALVLFAIVIFTILKCMSDSCKFDQLIGLSDRNHAGWQRLALEADDDAWDSS
eukprot:m.16780 g.16780  ORF g.16780 m.16780 type:complete len:657 (+) comp7236_c0_seq1:141-2111(+)